MIWMGQGWGLTEQTHRTALTRKDHPNRQLEGRAPNECRKHHRHHLRQRHRRRPDPPLLHLVRPGHRPLPDRDWSYQAVLGRAAGVRSSFGRHSQPS